MEDPLEVWIIEISHLEVWIITHPSRGLDY
jgi:hypothetical protein